MTSGRRRTRGGRRRTARSMSGASPAVISVRRRPVAGFSVAKRSPLRAGRSAPSMNASVRNSGIAETATVPSKLAPGREDDRWRATTHREEQRATRLVSLTHPEAQAALRSGFPSSAGQWTPRRDRAVSNACETLFISVCVTRPCRSSSRSTTNRISASKAPPESVAIALTRSGVNSGSGKLRRFASLGSNFKAPLAIRRPTTSALNWERLDIRPIEARAPMPALRHRTSYREFVQ